MHSTRILSLVLFFLTFGLFVSAGPIENTNALAKRCDTCSSGELDLIKILTDLQVGVQVDIDAAMKGELLHALVSALQLIVGLSVS